MAEVSDKRLVPRLIAVISFLAAVVALFTFVTGWPSLAHVKRALSSEPVLPSDQASPVEPDLSSPNLLPSLVAHEFKLKLGDSGNDFSYDTSGQVLYRSSPFKPRVYFTPVDTPEILISLPDALSSAGIIGLDSDGQRSFFVASLADRHSIFCKAPARQLYWSPDQRWVVSLNVYEGQYFSSVDLNTGVVRTSRPLGLRDTLWYVEGNLRWSSDGRYFLAKIVETKDQYEDPKTVDNTPVNSFPVRVGVQNMSITILE